MRLAARTGWQSKWSEQKSASERDTSEHKARVLSLLTSNGNSSTKCSCSAQQIASIYICYIYED